MKTEPTGNPDGLDVGCERLRGGKDDAKACGLSSWKDGVATARDGVGRGEGRREGGASERAEARVACWELGRRTSPGGPALRRGFPGRRPSASPRKGTPRGKAGVQASVSGEGCEVSGVSTEGDPGAFLLQAPPSSPLPPGASTPGRRLGESGPCPQPLTTPRLPGVPGCYLLMVIAGKVRQEAISNL